MKHLCLGFISLTLVLFSSVAQAQTCTQALDGPANTMGCWSDVLSNADGWPLVTIHPCEPVELVARGLFRGAAGDHEGQHNDSKDARHRVVILAQSRSARGRGPALPRHGRGGDSGTEPL